MKKLRRIIGVLFLIPPVLGVLSFTLGLCGCKMDIATLNNLSSNWTYTYYPLNAPVYNGYGNRKIEGGAPSSAPIYLGLMAIAGAYLIKE